MNKQKIVIVVLSWVIVFITMFMISNFSMQDAEASTETSDKVVDTVIELLPNKDQITLQQKNEIRFSIRKLAHFGIYMLLGFTMINAVKNTFSMNTVINTLISIFSSSFYSIIDEFVFQRSSSGRAPSWMDVGIDTLGAILGVILFTAIIFTYNKIFKSEKTNGIHS